MELLFMMAFIAGCVIFSNDPDDRIIQTSISSEVTGIPLPSSTQISTPAYTLTPDVPSATFTAAPTWTLLATLPIEEAENAVAELFLNNRNCQLPCWWGIVPGETTWREAHAMLSTLVLGDIYYGQIL